MKTHTSETENIKVQYTAAETLEELQSALGVLAAEVGTEVYDQQLKTANAEIVKVFNDYINRHHMLPEVRTALRGEVTAKTMEGQAKQAACFKALSERVKPASGSPEVLDLYEFLPTRRVAKEDKAAQAAVEAAKEAVNSLTKDIIARLVANGMTETQARSMAGL
jgi:hypothetical protein